MGTALEGGEGEEMNAGGGGQWSKTPRRGERSDVISYLRVGSLEPLIVVETACS